MNNINQILKEVISEISPSEEELKTIKKQVNDFTQFLQREVKKHKINAQVFVGGSFAKDTLIKKGNYDIDVFVRFSKKYNEKEISGLLENILRGSHAKKVHGSRDYFRVDFPAFYIEIIPVMAVKNPKEAENITDLSYFHVNYIKKKLKTEKILGEVKLAKAFCHASKSYGAESYVNGFSGYALELLIHRYKSFLGFIKAMVKVKDREIIDIEKLYKNKYEVEMNMNSAKMKSPVILIDPTYKERNALAALSGETFSKFRESGKRFLKNPSRDYFEIKKVDFEKAKTNAEKNRFDFILLETRTDKQEGDIAGSKLLKFYRHLNSELSKFYDGNNTNFEYNDEKEAKFFFAVKARKEIVLEGPRSDDKGNSKAFRKKHKNTFVKKGRVYAKEKNNLSIEKCVNAWKIKNKRKISEMDIKEIKIINFL